MALTLFGHFRIGEASVPGPNDSLPPHWHLGVCNPSGLLGKSHILASVDVDIVAISETHLTSQSRRSFFNCLKATGKGFRSFVSGAPMAPRSFADDVGEWAGVAFASKHPSRALVVDWPIDLFDTGRIQFSGTFIDHCWVNGCVVYGYPAGVTHLKALERTAAMLDFAFDHLHLHCLGPRYLAGDWNFEPHQLLIWSRLEAAGWVEIQDLLQSIDGSSPQPTSKHRTRKDFLWLSPELARRFVTLSIHDVFADHSYLVATFQSYAGPPVRWLWPKPAPIEWRQVPDIPTVVDFAVGDPSDQYETLWQHRERQAESFLADRWTSKMAGRAKFRHPQKKVGWPTPLKKGRSHDVQPQFWGVNTQHARWFKQLRRLQSYLRWCTSSSSGSQTCYGVELWQAVLKAPGFYPSFQEWWFQRKYRCPLDLDFVPQYPPCAAAAQCIYDALLAETRALESSLRQATLAVAKHKREQTPNTIFQDVRRPAALPVETLLDSKHSIVVALDEPDMALELDPPCTFEPGVPLVLAGQPLVVHHAEPDKLWVDRVPDNAVGAKVVQHKQLGTLPEIFDAFHEQWKKRWCRHDAVPNSQWHTITEFARHVMPHAPAPELCIDEALLKAEVHRKKKTSATGLDGASREDFLWGGPHFNRSILSLYERACQDGQWPSQIMSGAVSSLAKTPDASSVNQFRPITIFGFAYRCWASLHARALLDHADTWVHPDIYGNRKAHQAAHLWKSIVSQIEEAYASGLTLSGLTADIEKAYNCLPRWPIFVSALCAGTPFSVITGWAGAVQQMRRHFKVQDSYSQGFETSTGLAEGCALSCYGMLLLDHLFHVWVHHQQPTIRALSYVDNWDVLTWNPDLALRQLDLVLQFASLVDLSIDRQKTFGWSTHASVRKAFRDEGIRVLPAARDLGAHVAFTKQYTNSTITSRLDDLDTLWQALRRSPSPFHLKVRVLRTVAWPRGLHAISSAPVGRSVWGTLRSKAVQALWGRRAGVNPAVLLGLIEGAADPEEVALISTIRDTREFCDPQFMSSVVAPLAEGWIDLPATAPAHILLTRLHRIGVTVTSRGSLCDSFGEFDLQDNFNEILFRCQFAWSQQVASMVQHRSDFQGLYWTDVVTTRRELASLSCAEQTLFRLGLSGGSFTADLTYHWSSHGRDSCQWCGAPDSLFHRYWQCPATQPLRLKHAPTVAPLAAVLPSALTLRGWALHSRSWHSWVRLLASLPRDIPDPAVSWPAQEWVDVYTDGSCLWQSQPALRVASWSAVVAAPFSAAWTFQVHGVLGASFLPGIIQTAYRAELYAVAYTLHWAARSHIRVHIWSDCLGVINRLVLLCHGKRRVRPNTSNGDLWQWIVASLRVLGTENLRITKVAAHQSLTSAKSKKQAWIFWNNGAADRAARMANVCRPAGFWQHWSQHAAETWKIQKLFEETVSLQLAVAAFSVQTKSEDPAMADTCTVRLQRVFHRHYDAAHWTQQAPPTLVAWYTPGLVRNLITWWRSRVKTDPTAQLRWVPLVFLYIDWQMTWGCPGPLKIKKQWVEAKTRPHLAPERFKHNVRMRWFRSFLQAFWKYSEIQVTIATCKPDHELIQAHIPCVSRRLGRLV